MLVTIESESLIVGVETRGAELRSVRSARTGTEYLWQGDPSSWAGRAPLLFPLIGRLKGKSYTHAGRRYSMDIHGFARNMDFRVLARDSASLALALGDSPQTRESWPFEFELELRYRLSGSTLRKEHLLKNKGATELLYELGGHEGYNVPLFPGEKFSDYHLQFEGMDSLVSRCVDADIMLTRERRSLELEEGRLALDARLFEEEALILEDVAGRAVALASSLHKERIRLSFPDFLYLGIWTMAGQSETRFLCIEPWSSLPDCAYLGEELDRKEGIRRLAPGASEALAYTIELGPV